MKKLLFILLVVTLTSCITIKPVRYKHPAHKIVMLLVIDSLQTKNQNNNSIYGYKAIKLLQTKHDTVTLYTLQSYKIGDKVLIPINNEN
jgi:hypothetical protein